MSTEQFYVLNVKCGGCASNIKEGLGTINGVSQVEVDISEGKVRVQGDALQRETLAAKLEELGYPEKQN